MKKILLSASCALACSAIAPLSAVEQESGFSASVYGGGISSTSTLNRTLSNSVNTTRTDLGGKGGTAGLMVAYDHAIKNNSIVGLDVFGSWHSMKSKIYLQDGAQRRSFDAKMNYSFGTAARFGYKFAEETLGFVRIGYINSHFKLKSINSMISSVKSNKKNSSGLLLGVGIEVPVMDKVALGLGYDFALYKKCTLSHQYTANHNFKPRLHFLNASIKYKF